MDDRPVVPDEERKSLGREVTLEQDVVGREECLAILWDICQQVGWRLRSSGLWGYTVTLKIKTAKFQLLTRSRTLEEPVQLDEDLREQITLLSRQWSFREPVRLLGVTVSHLSREGTTSLNFDQDDKAQKRAAALDALKQRFGEQIIYKGTRRT